LKQVKSVLKLQGLNERICFAGNKIKVRPNCRDFHAKYYKVYSLQNNIVKYNSNPMKNDNLDESLLINFRANFSSPNLFLFSYIVGGKHLFNRRNS